MYISRIKIQNFRNFSNFDVSSNGNAVVVGENRVGKTNFLHAIRLLLDPTLADSSRQLHLTDFWDGIDGGPSLDDKIIISIEIKEFEEDLRVCALLTDYRLNNDPHTVRLTYEFRPLPDLTEAPRSREQYDFICYGGEDAAKTFNYTLRSVSLQHIWDNHAFLCPNTA
jgi:putative ATP-dependent endonuclease of OLD family